MRYLSRVTFTTIPPFAHCGVIFVLDLPPGAKRATTGGEERQNIKAASKADSGQRYEAR